MFRTFGVTTLLAQKFVSLIQQQTNGHMTFIAKIHVPARNDYDHTCIGIFASFFRFSLS